MIVVVAVMPSELTLRVTGTSMSILVRSCVRLESFGFLAFSRSTAGWLGRYVCNDRLVVGLSVRARTFVASVVVTLVVVLLIAV